MTTKTEAKPSAGALRAAKQIMRRVLLPTEAWPWSPSEFAEIIDRETSHQALLEAAQDVVRASGLYPYMEALIVAAQWIALSKLSL